MADSNPWEYIPGFDSGESWRAFSFYIALPPPRRFSDVDRAFQLSAGTSARWAKETLWRDRAHAWDTHVTETHQEETLALVKRAGIEIAAGQLELLSKARTLVATELTKHLKHALESGLPVTRVQELRTMIDSIVKWERLIAGQSTERVEDGIDLSGLTNEELKAWEYLNEKARELKRRKDMGE